MKLHKIFITCLCSTLLLMNTQCDEDDVGGSAYQACGQPVIIDNTYYESATSGTYDLADYYIEDHCLTVVVSSSGCDGNSWTMDVVDSEAIAESSPEQRYLKFVFTNNEACLAVFTRTREFDLTALQVNGSNEIILNIEDFPEPLSYIY